MLNGKYRLAAVLRLAPPLALCFFLAASCDGPLEAECDSPGSSQKCTCPSGVGSRQVCSAEQIWGPCYCDPQACGDADLDPGESCDDGNRDSGDGCSEDCQLESMEQSSGPGSGGSAGSSSIMSSASTGMGGMAAGGSGGTSSAGGAGGAGGAAGSGGN